MCIRDSVWGGKRHRYSTEREIQRLRETVNGTDSLLDKAKRYTDITELPPELLRLFIERIVVHKKEVKWSRAPDRGDLLLSLIHISALGIFPKDTTCVGSQQVTVFQFDLAVA